jgi:hypothetical protein
MAQIDPSLTERQQYWLKHICACDAAGKPSVEYARERLLGGMPHRSRDRVSVC